MFRYAISIPFYNLKCSKNISKMFSRKHFRKHLKNVTFVIASFFCFRNALEIHCQCQTQTPSWGPQMSIPNISAQFCRRFISKDKRCAMYTIHLREVLISKKMPDFQTKSADIPKHISFITVLFSPHNAQCATICMHENGAFMEQCVNLEITDCISMFGILGWIFNARIQLKQITEMYL